MDESGCDDYPRAKVLDEEERDGRNGEAGGAPRQNGEDGAYSESALVTSGRAGKATEA